MEDIGRSIGVMAEETITDKDSKDSKETQESQEKQEKQILDIYFSYGEDKTKLDKSSRHSSDVNLHLKTKGYEDGESITISIKTQDETFEINDIISDNQLVIESVFKDRFIQAGEIEVYA